MFNFFCATCVLIVLLVLLAFSIFNLIRLEIKYKELKREAREYLKAYKPVLEERADLIRQNCSEGIAAVIIDYERIQYEKACREMKVPY